MARFLFCVCGESCVGDERFGGDPRNDDLLAALNIHVGSEQGGDEEAAAVDLPGSNSNSHGAELRAEDGAAAASAPPPRKSDHGDEGHLAAGTERNSKSGGSGSTSASTNPGTAAAASTAATSLPASAPSNGVKLERLRAALTSPSAAELEGGDHTPSSSRRHHESGGGSPRKKGGGANAPPNSGRVMRWDDGLDVGRLRIAFLEMAESGVIFDKHKELSLHLSRSQAKPFVHNSATNASVFLDDVHSNGGSGATELVSPEVVVEANAIMHKLIRHYMRKQQQQQQPTRRGSGANGSSNPAATSSRAGRQSAEASAATTSMRPHTRASAKSKSANPAGASLMAAAGAGQVLLSPPLTAAPRPPTGGFFLSPGSELEQAGRLKNPRSSLGPKKSTGGPRVV